MFKRIKSSFTTKLRLKPHAAVKLQLEVLEDRKLLNADLLIWNPGKGDGTSFSSHAANWWDNT